MATLYRNTRTGVTAKRMTLEEVVECIRSKEYEGVLRMFRAHCGTVTQNRNDDGTYRTDAQWEEDVPRICFSADYMKHLGVMRRMAYNGLVTLEVGSLMNSEEAAELRLYASRLPQTLLTFVGADGRSIVVVCRAELPDGRRTEGVPLPTEEEEIGHFHQNAYEKARQFYTGQLGIAIDMVAPRMDRICYMSADAELSYRPEALPFYVDADAPQQLAKPRLTAANDDVLPGYDLYRTQVLAVQACLSQAFDDALAIEDEQEMLTAVLSKQAHYCLESGIPKDLALRLTLYHGRLKDERLLAEKIFDNAYTPSAVRKAVRKNPRTAVLHHIPGPTLLMLNTNAFMEQNYQFRKNELTGEPQFRSVAWPYFDFRDVTREDRNTMTRRAQEAGLKSWDNDIRRYIESNDIPLFNPIDEYFNQLPNWDGRDRLEELASRVPTDDALWPRMLRIWMRSMVAHWMGRDPKYGNALVPLLIGPQGCGKTTFCRLVLPEELRDYYNDYIDFTKKFDLLNMLCSFVLVNIDEFDSIKLGRQPELKLLLSKADVKLRVPYGRSITRRRRYASFIATTNNQLPLSDPTGSRRFFCVNITGTIDNTTPIDYEQLYAQLQAEVKAGERYWLTDEENAELMEHNEQFQQLDSLEEMVRASCFAPDPADNTVKAVPVADILNHLVKKYCGLTNSKSNSIKLGLVLKKLEFKKGPDGRNNNTWIVVLK